MSLILVYSGKEGQKELMFHFTIPFKWFRLTIITKICFFLFSCHTHTHNIDINRSIYIRFVKQGDTKIKNKLKKNVRGFLCARRFTNDILISTKYILNLKRTMMLPEEGSASTWSNDNNIHVIIIIIINNKISIFELRKK